MKTNKQKTKNGQHTSPVVEPTEGARRATGVGSTTGGGSGDDDCSFPDPEVPENKPRRKFTAKYKLRILDQVEACTKPGQIGELLRREGLYSSSLTTWRRQKAEGILQAMKQKKRGRKIKKSNPLSSEVAQLQREKRQLQQKLKQAELIIEAQKKISEILGITQNIDENERSDS